MFTFLIGGFAAAQQQQGGLQQLGREPESLDLKNRRVKVRFEVRESRFPPLWSTLCQLLLNTETAEHHN